MNKQQLAIMEKIADKTLSFGCICKFKTYRYKEDYTLYYIGNPKDKCFVEINSLNEDVNGFYEGDGEYEIIGHPITLARVLSALGDDYFYHNNTIKKNWFSWQDVCNRKLLNKDGSDATLFNQSQETIDKVAELLGVK